MRKYTAREMRRQAKTLEHSNVSEMLLQAADYMERGRKYEYGIHPVGVFGVYQTLSAAEMQKTMLELSGYKYTIVRREVGEWESINGKS